MGGGTLDLETPVREKGGVVTIPWKEVEKGKDGRPSSPEQKRPAQKNWRVKGKERGRKIFAKNGGTLGHKPGAAETGKKGGGLCMCKRGGARGKKGLLSSMTGGGETHPGKKGGTYGLKL